jgi:Cdc6-like AAA superfamily ATPase
VVALYQVPAEKLRRRLDPASLPFKSTQEVAPLRGTLGQRRAMEALEFGIGVDSAGYNLFVTGLSGSGRTHTVREFLQEIAATRVAPDDWVYVHDFEQPDRPKALRLPVGRGRELSLEGRYPQGTIHYLVTEKLRSYARLQKAFAASADGEGAPRKQPTAHRKEGSAPES